MKTKQFVITLKADGSEQNNFEDEVKEFSALINEVLDVYREAGIDCSIEEIVAVKLVG